MGKIPGEYSCKITDLGFSSPLYINTHLKAVAGLKGPSSVGFTLNYAAPELLNRSARLHRPNMEINLKMDVYSFAITMFETIVRQQVWPNVPDAEIRERVTSDERPIWPVEKIAEFGGRDHCKLFDLIEKCWDPNAEKRPSFAEIHSLLLNDDN